MQNSKRTFKIVCWLLVIAALCGWPARAVAPWVIHNNATNGVTMTAATATTVTAVFPAVASFHYVGVTNLHGRLRRSDAFAGGGRISFLKEAGFNGAIWQGFFETQNYESSGAVDAIGLKLMEPFNNFPGTLRVYPIIRHEGAVLAGDPINLNETNYWAFGFTWSPTGGATGHGIMTLSATNEDTLSVQTTTLEPTDYLRGFAVNSYGLWEGFNSPTTNKTVTITLDSPWYTQLTAPPALPPNMHTFISAGQSNDRGNNAGETNGIPYISEWTKTNVFIFEAGDPEWSYARVGDPLHNSFGPEISFASAWAAEFGVPVGIIKVAKGGTPLSPDFMPATGTMYTVLTNTALTALNLLTTPQMQDLIHVAGETDAGVLLSAANYGANFQTFYNRLVADVGITNYLITRVHSWAMSGGHYLTYSDQVRSAQTNLGHWVNTDDLTPGAVTADGYDPIHFSTASQFTIGYRLARKKLEIQGLASTSASAGTQYPILVANVATLATLDPKGKTAALLMDSGKLLVTDQTSFAPTNSGVIRPTGKFGRWLATGDGDKGDITESEAGSLMTINAGTITDSKIAIGAVTLLKMAANSVNSASIVDGTIVRADMGSFTSSQWKEMTTDETGTGGSLVFANTPSINTPIIGGKIKLPYTTSSPGLNEIGDMKGWQNLYAVGRGAMIHYDGTAETVLLGTLASDTPTNGQVPKFNTGGTITWEDENVSDTAYNATTWDAVTGIAPSKNAVRDEFETVIASVSATVSDTAYDATSWNSVTTIAPSKNAVRDELETIIASVSASTPSDSAFGSGWNSVTTVAPSKNSVYDALHLFDADDDGKVDVIDLVSGIVKTDSNGSVTNAVAETDYVTPSGSGTLANKTLTSPKIANVVAPANATNAVVVSKADGTTSIFVVDTTNSRVGVNMIPSAAFSVHGRVRVEDPTLAVDLVLGDISTTPGSGSVTISSQGGNGSGFSFVTRNASIHEVMTLDKDGNLSLIPGVGKISLAATLTTGGTTGNQTINKPTGSVNIAASGTTVTVTDSFCTTSSIVFAVIMTNDTTSTIKNVVPGSGSFVITLTAAATAETKVGFWVIN